MSTPVERHGLRRFSSDLPAVAEVVTLGEGDTPLVPLVRLGERLKLRRLSAKMESLNPTGSYKDRAAAMSLSLARDRGQAGWIATSSGNAGLAMAAYGARAGVPGFLCVVAGAPREKLLPLMPYRVHVVAVEGVGQHATAQNGREFMNQVRAAAERHDLFLGITAHAFNPDGMRGIDTISYELVEQVPDATHIYVPTGGGGLLVAIARGLEHRGMPAKVICCQPSGCAPIVAFLDGRASTPEFERCDSDVSALQLAHPPDGECAAQAVKASEGWGTAVHDNAILAAQRLLAADEGISVEPAAATGLAALIVDVTSGRIGSDDHPVLLLTGAGWKDLGRFTSDAERMTTIKPQQIGGCVDEWKDLLHRR